MKIYIAGKITGDPRYREKFARARAEVERLGHVVLNPAALPSGLENGDYMRICFSMIDSADAVVFLEDWNLSEGARLEHAFCKYINKRIWFLGWVAGAAFFELQTEGKERRKHR